MLTKEQKLQIIADNTMCSEAGDEAGYSMVTDANAETLFDAIAKAVKEDLSSNAEPVAEVTVTDHRLGVRWLPHPEGMVGRMLFLSPTVVEGASAEELLAKDRHERKAIPDGFALWLMSRASDSYSCGLLVKEALERLHHAFKDPNDPAQALINPHQLNSPVQGFTVDLEFGPPPSHMEDSA